jgi:riboflavin synthase
VFTGIVETVGKVEDITLSGSNKIFTLTSGISNELSIDQSVSHNGVCLTVIEVSEQMHKVEAIHETLIKTNLNKWKIGDLVNLERAMKADGRLDGHFVQGHVDMAASCIGINELDGSRYYSFQIDPKFKNLIINKGSIAINGVSLTIVDADLNRFSVAIIPYTFEHTNFNQLHVGSVVNIEFDMIGKYLARYMANIQTINPS